MSKNNPPPKIRAILFDLGKVLMHFNFDPAFRRLARSSSLSAKDIEDYFVLSGVEVPYDGGKVSSREFYRQVKAALKLRLTFEGFRRVWNGIFTPKTSMIALVRRLRLSRKRRYRLVLISNTNAMHYEHLRKRYPVLGLFDRRILSFRERKRKPDERLYRTAIRACKAKAGEIFYIDDRADLTEAAAAMGIRTFTFRDNIEALLAEMKKLDIL